MKGGIIVFFAALSLACATHTAGVAQASLPSFAEGTVDQYSERGGCSEQESHLPCLGHLGDCRD
jgi:hypothetical protein